ncbi:right-handed parallel beta-helix repeat-containing protein [Agromyces sp. NPDC056965]|uniref:right-handed parallel beta-helix repeat-containing protein n=1 Tax=Agromyces sp. NPDC056965 TaxID=3345983 RepID=UPI00362FD013
MAAAAIGVIIAFLIVPSGAVWADEIGPSPAPPVTDAEPAAETPPATAPPEPGGEATEGEPTDGEPTDDAEEPTTPEPEAALEPVVPIAPTVPLSLDTLVSSPSVAPAPEALAAEVAPLVAPVPPVGASDAALIAWVGATEPAMKITLQAALNAVPAGGTVGVVPGAYRFASQLVVARSTVVTASAATTLYGRWLVNAGGLTADGITLSAAANSQSVVTLGAAAADVALTDLVITNSTSDGATPFTATTGVNLAASQRTQVIRPTITDVSIALALATSTSADVEDAVVSSVATGASITAANANAGPVFDGGSFTVTAAGIALGATGAPSITGITLLGAGVGVGVNVNNATALTLADSSVTGFASGVVLANANAGAGPTITDTTVGAATMGVNLGTSQTPQLDTVTVTGTGVAGTTYGIYVANSTGAVIETPAVSGFARGVYAVDASAVAGPTITAGTIAASSVGIGLGATTGASVTGTQLSGPGAGTTYGVNVLNASDVTLADLVVTGFNRAIQAAPDNAGTGLRVTAPTIVAVGAKSVGVGLGSMVDAVVDGADISGDGAAGSTGIALGRAPAATVTDPVISGVVWGIQEQRVTLAAPIAGPAITGARITGVGSGIYLASSSGATVTDTVLDMTGDGITGHEAQDVTIDGAQITGHPSSTPLAQQGSNGIRFYYSAAIAVADVHVTGGATAFYWDMTDGVTVEDSSARQTEWWATYAESVTGYVVRDSAFDANAAIGNLTINPSNVPPLDLARVSSDVLFTGNTFTDNPRGLYLPLGARDIVLAGNDFSGTAEYVVLAAPVHGLEITGNSIDFEPASARAEAITVRPLYEDLYLPGSASSSGISVTENVFTGSGPFLGVGTPPPLLGDPIRLGDPLPVDVALPGPPADDMPGLDGATPPPDPEFALLGLSIVPFAMVAPVEGRRSLSDTIHVALNTFPQDSIAIVAHPNAEVGEDSDPTNDMIDGNVAVDAREETEDGQNDWGSACGPRVEATGYDGGGAFILEVRTTQVLYPEFCDPEPPTPPAPAPAPTPGGGPAAGLAASGWDPSTGALVALLMAAAGIVAVARARMSRARARSGVKR